MSVAIITDARGAQHEACGPLHTPPLPLKERVSPGMWLLLLAIPLCAMAAPVLVLFLVPGWFLTWLSWWFVTGRQEAAERMAARGCCPSCEYELHGLDAQDDGATTCPECGAAWSVGPRSA
ncbi:MAG: hypothetical protein HRU13_02000 [Phycisphaerales bacterium]|nr:hypothetical protein [Phycisphaerales bacterium]